MIKKHALQNLLVLTLLFIPIFLNSTLSNNIHADEYSADIQNMANIHNQYREEQGLPKLKINKKLNESAQNKAEEMLRLNCWAHTCNEEVTPWAYIKATGYNYKDAGENLAEGFDTKKEIMEAWLNSPTHKANIDATKYEEIGVGIARGDFDGKENNTLIVIHFGTQD